MIIPHEVNMQVGASDAVCVLDGYRFRRREHHPSFRVQSKNRGSLTGPIGFGCVGVPTVHHPLAEGNHQCPRTALSNRTGRVELTAILMCPHATSRAC